MRLGTSVFRDETRFSNQLDRASGKLNPMQGGGGAGPLGMTITPWVKRIMVTTAVFSIVGAIAYAWMGSSIPLHLGLTPQSVWGGGDLGPVPALWQLLTYPFVIFHPIGLLLAILMFGWFGGTLESWWGSVRFFKYFFGLTTVVAGLTVLLALFWPNLAAQTFLGPFPIIAAMIVAWGLTFPDRVIRLFFVLPVKGIHMVWISAGITTLYIIFSGAVAPFVPHILGMVFSAALVTGVWRGRKLWLYLQKWKIQSQIKREQDARKRRVGKAGHLRVVDPDESPEDEETRRDGGDDDGGKGNGAGKNGAGNGWLH